MVRGQYFADRGIPAVATDSIRDEDLDGYFDAGQPYMETVVNGAAADANHGLRRFFINEIYKDSGQITVNLYPNVAPDRRGDFRAGHHQP